MLKSIYPTLTVADNQMRILQARLGEPGMNPLRKAGALYLLRMRGRGFCSPRNGIVLATAILSMVALLGVAALTIDLGRLAVATQRAQDVADAAAMGAAYQLPDRAVAWPRLVDAGGAHNSAHSWPTATVAAGSDVTFYDPENDVPNFGLRSAKQYAVTVTAHVYDHYTFGRVAGLSDMHTQRSSTAVVTHTSGGRAVIFAMSEAQDELGFDSQGGNIVIDGDLHSNGSVKIKGPGNALYGQLRYRWDLDLQGAGGGMQVLGGIVQIANPAPWPLAAPWICGFDAVCDYFNLPRQVDDVSFKGPNQTIPLMPYVIVGNLTIKGANCVFTPGVYLVDGSVSFQGATPTLDGVTIIARDTITFKGATAQLTPFIDDMSLVAYGYADPAISHHGASQTSSGTIFAPNGKIDYHGASGHRGSLIGYQIKLHGSSYTVDGGGGGGTLQRRVRLVY